MADELRNEGMRDQAEGTAKELEGKVQKNVADAVDDESEQFKGAVKELGGKIQKNFGKAEQKLDDPGPDR